MCFLITAYTPNLTRFTNATRSFMQFNRVLFPKQSKGITKTVLNGMFSGFLLSTIQGAFCTSQQLSLATFISHLQHFAIPCRSLHLQNSRGVFSNPCQGRGPIRSQNKRSDNCSQIAEITECNTLHQTCRRVVSSHLMEQVSVLILTSKYAMPCPPTGVGMVYTIATSGLRPRNNRPKKLLKRRNTPRRYISLKTVIHILIF